jgi:hypothetical protein
MRRKSQTTLAIPCADTREVIRANQAATGGRQGVIGKPPFGYHITGAKLNKRLEIDPVTGPLALQALQTEPGARRVLDAMASPGVTDADRYRMTAIILKLAVRCEAPCSITHQMGRDWRLLPWA